MKNIKKIILVILVFFITGCYDYIELNDLSIITGIAIDRESDSFLVSFEILNDTKSSSETVTTTAEVVTGSGKTISEAFANTSKKVPKLAFYSHLKILIISEDVAKDNMPQMIDFLLRSPRVRNEFFVLIAEDTEAKGILKNSSESNPIVSDQIETMLNNNRLRKNNASPYSFEEIVENFLNKRIDASISTLKLIDKDISLEGLALYEQYKLKDFLSSEESTLYNILINNAKNIIYEFPCGENSLSLSIYEADTKIKIKENKVFLNMELDASVVEYSCKESLKNEETYLKLNEKYAKEINEKLTGFYKTLLKNNSDILAISKKYYDKYRKDTKWTELDYELTTKLKVNKDGLIFEVNNDN